MRRLPISLAALFALAAPAMAQDAGWIPYTSATFGLSIQAPANLRLVGDRPTADDPAPPLVGMADLGAHTRLGFFVQRLDAAVTDPQAAMKTQAESLATNDDGVIDSETAATVAGAATLDIAVHNGAKSGRIRAVLRGRVLVLFMGVGPDGAPAELKRMEDSLTFAPQT